MRRNPFTTLAVICVVLLGGAMTLRALAADSPRNKVICMAHLKQIAQACILYTADNNGELPADLEVLKKLKYIQDDATHCPSAADDKTPAYEIVLKGKITAVKDADKTVMIREVAASHAGKRNVAYADGSVAPQD